MKKYTLKDIRRESLLIAPSGFMAGKNDEDDIIVGLSYHIRPESEGEEWVENEPIHMIIVKVLEDMAFVTPTLHTVNSVEEVQSYFEDIVDGNIILDNVVSNEEISLMEAQAIQMMLKYMISHPETEEKSSKFIEIIAIAFESENECTPILSQASPGFDQMLNSLGIKL